HRARRAPFRAAAHRVLRTRHGIAAGGRNSRAGLPARNRAYPSPPHGDTAYAPCRRPRGNERDPASAYAPLRPAGSGAAAQVVAPALTHSSPGARQPYLLTAVFDATLGAP